MVIDFRNPMPLYKQVKEDIKGQIASGKLQVGDQLDSQHILARKYGVSLITIKRAISDLISEGILYSRVGKGTYVASKSPGIDFTKHLTIGLVLRDLNSPFFSLITQAVEEKASEYGYNLLLSSSANRLEREENMIRHFLEIGVNGLIIASMEHYYRATQIVRQLHDEDFPYVMVSYIEDEDIYYVGTDNIKGGYIAAQHLIQLGYNKIGYINGEEGNLLGEKRKQGFLQALEEHGLSFNPRFEFRLRLRGEWYDYESGYEIGEKFVEMSDLPEAVFAYNDLSALGFQRAIIDKGLSVPDDVAIVGFDDIKRGVIAPVPLTTIHQPTDEIGVRAFKVLLNRMENRPAPIRTILSPSLVIRKSCGVEVHSRES